MSDSTTRTIRCRAALFDMDGVLVDSRGVVERTWRRWAARHGVDADALLRVAHGRRTSETLRMVVPQLASAAEVAWLDDAESADFEGVQEIPGAAAFVRSLPWTRWAVVTSSGCELALKRLERAGIPVPDILVTSADVERGKPDPEGYRGAAARLGCTAEQCVVFEDAPPGIEAGRTAGATVVALRTTQPAELLTGATAVIDNFRNVGASMAGDEIEIGLPGSGSPGVSGSPAAGRPVNEWDRRYAEEEFAYGTEPNDFVAEVAPLIPPGPVLCLAEGQGRNAIYLATRGHRVTAVDQSASGLARARALAAERGVAIDCVEADLSTYEMAVAAWSGIVMIFAHLPPELRRRVHARVVSSLRPGGVFVLEAYTPRQLAFGTGGPKTAELLMTRDVLVEELRGLEIVRAEEIEREVNEGTYHHGPAAVVRVLARRPAG